MNHFKNYIQKGLLFILSIQFMLLSFPTPNFAKNEVSYNNIFSFSKNVDHQGQKKDSNNENSKEDFDDESSKENEQSFEKKIDILDNKSNQIILIDINAKEFVLLNTHKNIQFLIELSTPPPKTINA